MPRLRQKWSLAVLGSLCVLWCSVHRLVLLRLRSLQGSLGCRREERGERREERGERREEREERIEEKEEIREVRGERREERGERTEERGRFLMDDGVSVGLSSRGPSAWDPRREVGLQIV